ncbi:hypothetical protein POM88_053248 [Heracleum sosnowskyi]|uniref:Arabinogalactan-like protein n=1 Tax=Heracleum sosnowskyi TaxID=360622 RepID=A0AAD8GQ36_9APIA|nr:hypothetical protein POM88_053248 [Heracleum sosnowskyi]
MSPYNTLLVLMLSALFFGSVISHAPGHKRTHSPVAEPPSVIHVPAPSPAVPVEPPVPTPGVEPALSPVEPPLVPSPSPVVSPSISTPPAEAPAPGSDAAMISVSVGLVTFGAFVVAVMA